MNTFSDIIEQTARQLEDDRLEEYRYIERPACSLPDVERIRQMMEMVKAIVFPGFFGQSQSNSAGQRHSVPANIQSLATLLAEQICRGVRCFDNSIAEDNHTSASELSMQFIAKLPEIKRRLATDVKSICDGDPATDSYGEVILSYPGIEAMVHYRTAHELLTMGIPVIPRIITELAHSRTGIDINPGATIGDYFSIDHGTGVVIGATCTIGSNVHLYQGVTLGARSFTYDDQGLPLDVPRHPTIEDNVVIYSNATILGTITVGHDSVIGGNVWLTESVPPYSRIVQKRPENHSSIMEPAEL